MRRGNVAHDDEKETAFPVQQLQPLLLGRSASRCTLCRLAAGRFACRAGSVNRTADTLLAGSLAFVAGWQLLGGRAAACRAEDVRSPFWTIGERMTHLYFGRAA